VFAHRESAGQVELGFTDAELDLSSGRAGDLERLEDAVGVRFVRLHQVHGADVVRVHDAADAPQQADAMVTDRPDVGLMVLAADCAPVVLVDAERGVIGAAHAGRPGVAAGVATRTVEAMRDLGAEQITGWIGPRVCGGCYEVPEEMRAEVSEVVPATWATTTWGTPSLDLAAGLRAQLEGQGVSVVDVGGCTREDERYHSFRRDAAAAGRHAGVVWRR